VIYVFRLYKRIRGCGTYTTGIGDLLRNPGSTPPVDKSVLAIWEVSTTKQGRAKKVVSYINFYTGEVIPATTVKASPLKDFRKRLPEQARILRSLRPEVRDFAGFVLSFRNKRRGISPGVSVLCQWWARLTQQQVSHVRRYISRLQGAGILAGENLLCPVWQRVGGSARRHLGEDVHSAVQHSVDYLLGRRGPRAEQESVCSVDRDPDCMVWVADATPTGNLLTYEAYSAIILRISGKPPSKSAHEFAVEIGRGIDRLAEVGLYDQCIEPA
jgi:hypothetical protein